MKKLIACCVFTLTTWAAVNAQTTKQFSGVYDDNGNATYSYYYDSETGEKVKHGSFRYTATGLTDGASYTITGSFVNGLRNGTWVFKTTASGAKTSTYIMGYKVYKTTSGAETYTVNYKNGLFHGSFNASNNMSVTVKNEYGGEETWLGSKNNVIVKLNFTNGKLTGNAYIRDKEKTIKGQFDNQSFYTGDFTWNDKDDDISYTYKNGLKYRTAAEKQAYSDFEPYINSSPEEQWEKGFTVSKSCDNNNSYAKEFIHYAFSLFNSPVKIGGDLNDSKSMGGCVKTITDWRGNVDLDSLPLKKALDQAILNQDKLAIVQNIARLNYKNEKVTNPAKMQRLQDSLFVAYEYILKELQDHYNSVNQKVEFVSSQYKEWIENISENRVLKNYNYFDEYSFSNQLTMPKYDVYKNALHIESSPFRWDGNMSKYKGWVSRTKSEFLIGNFIQNYESLMANINNELSKKRGSIYNGNRSYNYYSFAFEESQDPIQSPTETIQSLLDLKEQEESVWKKSVVFIQKNPPSGYLKHWISESANIPAYHAYETISCEGCNTFESNDELIKNIALYKASLIKIDTLYDILDSLCKVENKLVVQQSELENQAASISKYPILNSSTELLIKGVSSALKSPKLKLEFAKLESCSEILTTAKAVLDQFNRAQADCDILNNAMGSYLAGAISFSQEIDSARAKSDLIVYSEYLTCYKLFETSVKALVTNSMSTPENLIQPEDYVEEINKRTMALNTLSVPLSTYLRSLIKLSLYLDGTKSAVANSGIKEYMSCYKVFESSLEPKITGGFTPPQSPTDVEDYLLEINNRTTTLTTEMEPFVLLQSVLSKPLTKENKKAIKGASKDPVALMAVLKTL